MAKGTTITFVGTLCLYLITLASRIAIVRTYTQAHWGEFNVGISLVGLLSTLGLVGLQQSLARGISFETRAEERQSIIRWSIVVSIAIGSITSALMYFEAAAFAGLFHDSNLVLVFQLLAPAVGFNVVAAVLASVHQGFEDASANALFIYIANPALFLGLLLLSLALGSGYSGLLIAFTAAWSLTTVGLAAYTLRRLPKHLPRLSGSWRLPHPKFWHFTVSLWGVNSLAFLTAYFDTLYLAAYWPAVTVGFYSAAMTLARMFLIANGITTFMLLPVVGGLDRSGRVDTVRSVFIASTRWVIAITLPLFLMFTFDPGLSIRAVFGKDFLPSTVPLVILSVGGFASVASGPVNATLAGLGKSRILLVTTGLSALVNVVLSVSLIPTYGAIGAAFAWAIARAVYPLSGAAMMDPGTRVSTLDRRFLAPFALALAIGIPAFALFNTVFLPYWAVIPLYFAGAGLFILAVFATRAVDPSDILLVGFLERILKRPFPRLRRMVERAAR